MSWLINHIKSLAEKPAIVDAKGSFNYADLSNQIEKYRAELDAQFIDGQVVAILSDYNFYSVALFLALYQNKWEHVTELPRSPGIIMKSQIYFTRCF